MLTNLFSAVTELGSQWLDGKKQIGKAKIDLAVETLKAEGELVSKKLDIKFQRMQNNFSLDRLAVMEAAKTWWDEFLCIVYLSPFIGIVYGTLFGDEDFVNRSERLIGMINHLLGGEHYGIGLMLIGVRYLGFRGIFGRMLDYWFGGKPNIINNFKSGTGATNVLDKVNKTDTTA